MIVAVAPLADSGRRLALAALPPMLFTLAAGGAAVPAARVGAVAAPPALRVMTVNLLMVNADTDGIIGEILAAKPDVLMLQEYTAGWHAAIQRAIGDRRTRTAAS